MTRPRRAVLRVAAFLILISFLCGGLAFALISRISPFPSLPVPGKGRLAYIGLDGNLYTSRPDGSELSAITRDAHREPGGGSEDAVAYQWPTWSPDGERLAFLSSRALAGGEGEERSLVVARFDGSESRVAFQSRGSLPIYLSWSPDGKYISFLTQETRDLALRLVAPETGPGSQRLLDRGAPFYFSWSPDSSALLLHIGGSWVDDPLAHISRLDLPAGEAVSLSSLPASFLTPGWSPDGEHLLFAIREEGESMALVQVGPSGQEEKRPVHFRGAISFQWSPTGEGIAYVVTPDPGLGTFGPLQIWRVENDSSQALTEENVSAFFWSPDGRKIAYLVPELVSRQYEQWVVRAALYVADVGEDQTRRLDSFIVSPQSRILLANFDQYAQSVSFWSPDSQHFAYAGQGEVGGFGIWVVDVQSGVRSLVAAGSMVVWSPQ